MPLETGDKISELNAAWPLGSDPKSQGDDHMRLIKAVMQADVVSKQEGGTFDAPIEVPDGATGKQVPNADDIPTLAGTGPVEIVEADVSAGWQVWGDTLIQWGVLTSAANGIGIADYEQPFKTVPGVSAVVYHAGDADETVKVVAPENTTTRLSLRTFRSGALLGPLNVVWIAVGEAPDDMKKPKTVQTVGGTEMQEGDGYQIVGTKLHCWGRDVAGTVTFPKVFDSAPVVTHGGPADAEHDPPTTTDVTIAGTGDIDWYAVGTWDGVS